ncbi:adenylate/guanylate cyclase domain-containing protein [Moorena sp. SIO3I6]|uniref:GAF domain-containing protein n=2 Tax=unclassified Moorena TaxID=2683338 RepID=UPI0013F7171F|nr:adenylate/guanylate cyclase domain-containing protein [Moorena sp. SIO3I6]NEP25675.1 GAF domain-containing protein [Moorena sp. SIO3I6]
MTRRNTSSVTATLSQLTQPSQTSNLIDRIKTLSIPQFSCWLDFFAADFQQFLGAIALINNEALETRLEQVIEALTLKVGQVLQADQATIFMVDTDTGQLWANIPQRHTNKTIERRIPHNQGVVGHVAATGKSFNTSVAYHHPLFNPEFDEIPGYRTQSLLCMPIFNSNNQVVAVINFFNKTGGVPFDSTDEKQFQDFADDLGIILEACQSFQQAARNQRGVIALLKATESLGKSLKLEETLGVVMEQARDLMQADRSTLFLLCQDRKELWSKVATADGQNTIEIRIPANRGIAGYVASTGEPLHIPDAYKDERFDPTTDKQTGYRTQSILCMPVFNSKNILIGVTQLINKHQGYFTSSDQEFMRAFNIQAGIALENAQLFESVLIEKQYQQDILQSLTDAVISTDMQGRIVMINDAAIKFLGGPNRRKGSPDWKFWQSKLTGRYIWDVVPIENLQWRWQDSLATGTRHYMPEQTLKIGIYKPPQGDSQGSPSMVLAMPKWDDPNVYVPWNETPQTESSSTYYLSKYQVQEIERSLNLSVNPLLNPEGSVRGGLVVLEDMTREKRMKTAMYRYMTPRVADQVLALGEDTLMQGKKQEVTILFSDIRGYTNLTEHLGATEVVSLLNKYFETMVEAVFNHDGTLDKFIGDALMAVFGAPLPLQNHAWKAVKSALDMRSRLAKFNSNRSRNNQPEIRIGMGISSGEVVSGNIGSQKRMDYTVIGDGVNLSARLESVTKEYGCDIILSEYTYNLCRDRIVVRELDQIRVKGKNQAVRIYELIGKTDVSLSDNRKRFLDLYQAGRNAYIKRDFQQALKYFTDALEIQPNDRPVKLHINRAKNYCDHPPDDSWDGVYTMTTK